MLHSPWHFENIIISIDVYLLTIASLRNTYLYIIKLLSVFFLSQKKIVKLKKIKIRRSTKKLKFTIESALNQGSLVVNYK